VKPKILISIVAIGAVVAVGAVAVYLNRSAPEEASLDRALTALDALGDAEAAEPVDPTADPTADAGDAAVDDADDRAGARTAVDGTWAVDTTIGDFDFGDATATFVGFRVDEVLNNVGETEAIGRTPAVDGTLQIDGATLTAAMIDADFTQMVSDISRRDGAMRRAMGVDANPIGRFALTQPVDFGEVPVEGETITFSAVGDLTVNGVTNAVEIDMEAQLADGMIVVVGRTPVVFADYDITAPVAGPVISVEDEGTVELQVWFAPA
jgi:polyisoprenoid-binding protein YceI